MKVAIIGFGKVGYHLTKAFLNANVEIGAVYNRSKITRPAILPDAIPLIHSLNDIPKDTDVLILSISDDEIQSVSKSLPGNLKNSAIIAHTSGIHGLEVFEKEVTHSAAFYPLNSFSTEGKVDWANTPIFITARSEKDDELLIHLAGTISQKVKQISDDQKAVLHTAAVFVNNFPNALFRMGRHILNENRLAFEDLMPLIETTFSKIKEMTPDEAQTGPASRGDDRTIQKHLDLLNAYPFEKQVYQLLTHYINPKLQDPHEND